MTFHALDLTLKNLKVFLQNGQIKSVLFSCLRLVLKHLCQSPHVSILKRESPLRVTDHRVHFSNIHDHVL